MQKRLAAVTALVAALAVMAVAASSAGAITMSVSPGGTSTATSSAVTFEGSGTSIICPLTMTQEFLRGPITVATNGHVGEVTAVRIGSCSGGSVSGVLNLNWRITINSTQPPIGSLTTRNATAFLYNMTGVAFNLSVFGGFINCLYVGSGQGASTLSHISRESTTYTASTFAALIGNELPLSRGGFGCPTQGHFAGTFLFASQTITLS